ncbi:MAG: hypothetical protein QM638_05095 [Nocardioides sp.]|uniref:hypothetical protein n=1 Tax=Nocardioides sp. TaxID=35761 RepID=UPI0039E722F7
MASRTRRGLKLSTAALAGLMLAGCGLGKTEEPPTATEPVTPSPTAEPSKGQAVLIGVRDGAPVQLGDGDVKVSVLTLDGGGLERAKTPDGTAGFTFPQYMGTGAYPRAVIMVRNAGDDDALNPGERAFTWGADFKVAAKSAGRTEDNGDNLIQRGLYSQSSEYKAELDLDRPACVVHGDEGLVTIRGDAVEPGTWYHMECHRDGYELTVTSWPLDQPALKSSRSDYGPTGDVTPAHADVPLTIGGKITSNDTIYRSSTDQFNGDVASPFLRIGREDTD